MVNLAMASFSWDWMKKRSCKDLFFYVPHNVFYNYRGVICTKILTIFTPEQLDEIRNSDKKHVSLIALDGRVRIVTKVYEEDYNG